MPSLPVISLLEGPDLGRAAALTAAALWAIASTVYASVGKTLSPWVMNLLKGCIAIVLLSLTLWALDVDVLGAPAWAVGLLLASGVIGIGMGDTAYFYSLKHLGPRRALLMGMLAPPTGAMLAFAFLGETLSPVALLGAAVTVAGVAWVIAERIATPPAPVQVTVQATVQETPAGEPATFPVTSHAADLRLGILFGTAAATCQAVGSVFSRQVFNTIEIDAFHTAWLRMLAGLGFVLLALPFLPRNPTAARLRRQPPMLWGKLAVACVLGTYLGISLMQLSFKYAKVGVAQTLLSTSPIWVLPLAWLLGERLTWRAVGGAFVALAGVAMLVLA